MKYVGELSISTYMYIYYIYIYIYIYFNISYNCGKMMKIENDEKNEKNE